MSFWKKLFGGMESPKKESSYSPHWKCPKCGAVLVKSLSSVDAPIGIVCGRCDAEFDRADVYGEYEPSSILEAAENGDLEKVRALLEGNPDLVFSKGEYALTPLHWAAAKGHKDVAELLLAGKADVNAKSIPGTTPLHCAALGGHKDVAELLLDNKTDVNAKDNDGDTPLHEAAKEGHKDVALLLLANKAPVNAKTILGDTPLHRAARRGNKDVAELLLANKAEINATNQKGETPLHYAARQGHTDVAELLRQHGGHE